MENPESCMHTGVIGVSDSELGICAQFPADFQARFLWFFYDSKKEKEMAGNQHCSCSLLGEWMKGKVIGSGSFGTVHLAMNKASGSPFCGEISRIWCWNPSPEK